MDVTFNRYSWLSWRGRQQRSKAAKCSSTDSSLDTLKLWISNGSNIVPSSRGDKSKWSSHEERRLGNENDMVLVPQEYIGGCFYGSDSKQDCDWSVGWLEPHGPEFLTDEDEESSNSFAVLVPCYGREVHNAADRPHIKFFDPSGNFSDAFPDGSKKYMEQWLSSLHNN